MIQKALMAALIFGVIFFGLKYSGEARENKRLAAELRSTEYRLEVAETNLAVSKAALADAQKAQTALSAHLDRADADAAKWRKRASDLKTKEGANETLNSYERAVLDSLLNE